MRGLSSVPIWYETTTFDTAYRLPEDVEDYLRKIIEYCKAEEIELTFIISPMYELRLISVEDYDSYVNCIREIAEEYHVPFYDFNLCKPEYLVIGTEDAMDDNHLNARGAYLYTSLLGQVMSGTEEENQKYFCDTYAEKLLLEPPQIFGLYQKDGEDKTLRYITIASNRWEGMEYRIIITPDNGEQRMIQDFTENKEFTLPYGESGIVTIVARMQESHEVAGTLEIPF